MSATQWSVSWAAAGKAPQRASTASPVRRKTVSTISPMVTCRPEPALNTPPAISGFRLASR